MNPIDHALQDWRQGDYVLMETFFTFRFSRENPLTQASEEVAQESTSDLVEDPVPGLVIVTQTCDIVRSSKNRPFIQVSPLNETDPETMPRIKKEMIPRYLFIPTLEQDLLVGDLDRIMTVEKAVVASWKRTPGCRTHIEEVRLRKHISRKFGRKAFPDSFTSWFRPFVERIRKKHSKNSEEGKILRKLREIRVRAEPSWTAPKPAVFLYFIIASDDETKLDWKKYLQSWMETLTKSKDFEGPEPIVTTLEDLTALDYVESDPLDLDYLTHKDIGR